MLGSRLAWIVIASAVGLLIAGFVTYFAVNAGSSPGATPTVPATASTEFPTTPLATEPPTETAPAPTEGPTVTEPPAAETDTPQPTSSHVDCGGPRHRLNVDKLRAQPQLADAAVTVVDEDTVQIDIQGSQFFVNGWGPSSSIGESEGVPDQLFDQVVSAIDAVLFEC